MTCDRDVIQQGPLPLSFDEKTALIAEITRLPQHKMMEVVEIIKEAMPTDLAKDNGDDIEVPLDDLDTGTLRKLQRFVAVSLVMISCMFGLLYCTDCIVRTCC